MPQFNHNTHFGEVVENNHIFYETLRKRNMNQPWILLEVKVLEILLLLFFSTNFAAIRL